MRMTTSFARKIFKRLPEICQEKLVSFQQKFMPGNIRARFVCMRRKHLFRRELMDLIDLDDEVVPTSSSSAASTSSAVSRFGADAKPNSSTRQEGVSPVKSDVASTVAETPEKVRRASVESNASDLGFDSDASCAESVISAAEKRIEWRMSKSLIDGLEKTHHHHHESSSEEILPELSRSKTQMSCSSNPPLGGDGLSSFEKFNENGENDEIASDDAMNTTHLPLLPLDGTSNIRYRGPKQRDRERKIDPSRGLTPMKPQEDPRRTATTSNIANLASGSKRSTFTSGSDSKELMIPTGNLWGSSQEGGTGDGRRRFSKLKEKTPEILMHHR